LSLVHKGSKRWQTVGAKRRKTIETIICEAVVRSLERENSVLEQERQEIATIEEPRWQRGRVGVYTLALASAEEQRGEAHDQRRKKPDRQPQAPPELPPPGSYLQRLLLEKKDEVVRRKCGPRVGNCQCGPSQPHPPR
jgi:hypothetical protein